MTRSRGHVPHRLVTDKARTPVKVCPVCLGMPWRRVIRCPKCLGLYAAEPPVTLADILERPATDN